MVGGGLGGEIVYDASWDDEGSAEWSVA